MLFPESSHSQLSDEMWSQSFQVLAVISFIGFWLNEAKRIKSFPSKASQTGVPKVPVIPRWHPPEGPAGPPAQRSDQPFAKAYSTGSRDKALHIAASPELRQDTSNVLNAQMWAKTARGPRQSRESLWNTIASTAGFQDPRDLTPLLLTTVTAILVQAGYRSTPAIVSQAVTSFKRKGWGVVRHTRPCKTGRLAGGSPPRHRSSATVCTIPTPPCILPPGNSKTMASKRSSRTAQCNSHRLLVAPPRD